MLFGFTAGNYSMGSLYQGQPSADKAVDSELVPERIVFESMLEILFST